MRQLLPLLLLSGCAVHSWDYGLEAPTEAVEAGGYAHLYVSRPGIFIFAFPHLLSLDGQPLPKLWALRYVARTIPAGPVELTAWGEVPCTIWFVALPDHAYYVRSITLTGWWYPRVQLEVEDPERGDVHIRTCSPAFEGL